MNTKFLSEIFVLSLPKVSVQNSNPFPITVPTVPDYGSDSRMLPALKTNLSINDIYENLTFYFANKTITEKDYKGEFYLLSTKQEVKPLSWKPDHYEFGFLKKGETLVFNQKYHPSFTTSVPNIEPCSFNGYLAVNSPKDITGFSIYYSPIKSFTSMTKPQPSCNLKTGK